MNLYDFLEYRKVCPICDTQLVTSFHSEKSQKIRMEDNRLVVIFHLTSLKKKHIDYKVGYSFGLSDDSFQTEFYTKDDKRFENDTPLFLMERFRELDKNLKGYRFYKSCYSCRRYKYSSSRFDLDLRLNRIKNLEIITESICLVNPGSSGQRKIFRMDNVFDTNCNDGHTWLSCWDATHETDGLIDYSVPTAALSIQLPIIPFISKEETTERIKTLLTFY